MRVVAILQVRLTSTRLPGKVLLQLGEETVLQRIIRAIRQVPAVNDIVIALPADAKHRRLAEKISHYQVATVTGSETDVLARFVTAAKFAAADIIVRITPDCPLTDPMLCQQLIELLQAERLDYAANNHPFSFPHGLDCEVFTLAALLQADRLARSPYEREHVTPWIRNSAGINKKFLLGPGGEYTHWRWTLDYPEDYDFIKQIIEDLGPAIHPWPKIAAYLKQNPQLQQINLKRRQR